MAIGDTVTIVLDIVAETTATGRIVLLTSHVVVIECADGSREASNRMNAKRA